MLRFGPISRIRNFQIGPVRMSAERLKTQLTQIEQLSETLNALLQSVTVSTDNFKITKMYERSLKKIQAAANPAIRKNIEGLESEKRKLIYQVN